MKRLVFFGGAALVAFVLVFVALRLERRSRPPLPAVISRTANVAALVAPPLGERVRRAFVGSAADHRIAGPKLIALTFDDGPYPVDTPQLLTTLHDLDVHATFFLIGRDAEQYPGLVREIAAGGHELANHTLTHPNLDSLDAPAVVSELSGGAAALSRIAPQPSITAMFRPPHGRFNATTLTTAQRAGYETVLWTDDPGDWRTITGASLLAHVMGRATSPEILLLHSGRPVTVAALPVIVTRFRAAGYTFVTAGALLARVTPDQLNHAARTPVR